MGLSGVAAAKLLARQDAMLALTDDKSEQENQVLKNKVERLEKQVSNIERLVEKQVSNLERLEDLLLQIVKKENN